MADAPLKKPKALRSDRPLKALTKTAKPESKRVTFSDGFRFGLGFWAAAFVFSFIIIPAIFCTLFLLISVAGLSIPALGG